MTTGTVSAEGQMIPWWVVLLEGIAAIIIGLLLLVKPGMTTMILVQFLGIYWLITGIFQIIAIFVDSTMWGWKLFAGALGIIAGILILRHPLWSTLAVPTVLATLLGIAGIAIGVINLIQAFQGGGWGIGILGVLSIIFGIILLFNPLAAAISLPVVLGVFGIVGGVLALIGAFRLKSQQPEIGEHAAAAVPAVGAELADVDVAEAKADVVVSVPDVEFPSLDIPGLSAVPDDVEKALRSLAPEVLSKLNNTLNFVEGIGPAYTEALKGIGITTLLALLGHGAAPKGRAEIAEKSEISPKLILEWLNHIDLYRIKGVGSEYADLLEEAGVDTVVELATRNPENLFNKLVAVNEEKKLVRRLPVESQVQDWVDQAKEMPRVINY